MTIAAVVTELASEFEPRQPTLAEAQDKYVWDWSWPPGCATLRKLPSDAGYSKETVLRVIELSAQIAANHAAVDLDGAASAGPPPIPASLEDVQKSLFSVAEAFHAGAPRTRPETAARYADYFAVIKPPPLVVQQQQDPASTDALFAWQRVGGANPMSLRRLTALPEDFPLTEAQWQAALGVGSLAAALGAGHVFGVDFTVLHGAPATRYLGRQKYICGTRGVFTAVNKALRPVAIQVVPGGPVFTPADGTAWAMARYFLQVADANIHETMEHLGLTHMVMEAVGVSAYRQLLADHPLRRLLDPHLVGTFAINNAAKTSLIAPDGVIDKVFAARIDVAAGLVRNALDRFVLQDRAPAIELAARGVDDATVLDYPYRDDVLLVYRATNDFVRAYIGLYYADDVTVAGDASLQAWVAEVGSPIGGALRGIRPVRTVSALVEWMTNIIHIGSTQHAAVNFPQFPFFSWGVNVAGACWGPPPTGPVNDSDLLALMPPWDCLFLSSDEVYELAGIHFTRLGDYSFSDPKAAPVVRDFQVALKSIEETVAARDSTRLLTYPFLRPSLIPASINI